MQMLAKCNLFWFIVVHMKPPKLIPLMVRVSQEAKALLEQAAREQRRSQASLVELLILEHLTKHRTAHQRIGAFLGTRND